MAEKLRDLIKTRGTVKAHIKRLINSLKSNTDFDIDDMTTRKTKLEDYYNLFYKFQNEIDILITSKEHEIQQDEEKAQFEEQYFECSKLISRNLRLLNNNATASGQAGRSNTTANNIITVNQSHSLLPKVEIRPFDGNPMEWHSFRDTFETLVHNDNQIPCVQKFHILKNALRGQLVAIIDTLTATEENYEIAWNLIKQRCNKPRQIIQSHLNSLLELPEIVKDSSHNLRSLRETAQMHVNALTMLNDPSEHWDSILVFLIIKKLDKITRRARERSLENEEKPKWSKLVAFLEKQERGEEIEDFKYKSSQNNYSLRENHMHKTKHHQSRTFITTGSEIRCIFCKGNHNIYACEQFLKLSPQDRLNAAKQKQLCINCLKNNHITSKCFSTGCKKCGKKHNSLLHFPRSESSHQGISENTGVLKSSVQEGNLIPRTSCTLTFDSEVLLGTARIKVLDKYNNEHECRVLLDGCSQSHFISERLADKLQLYKEKIDLPFAGLGQLTTRAQYSVETTIRSRINSYEAKLSFVALPKITGLLPARQINKEIFNFPQKITLADPEFDKSSEIDALIGTTVFYKLLCVGQIKLCNESIILQKTLLGWIVTGEVLLSESQPNLRYCHLITNLENQVARFWEMEEVNTKKILSKEETECEIFYNKTTVRDETGRYVVKLPFRNNKINLGYSYNMAVRRFYSLEKNLAKNLQLKNEYVKFLNEYKNLNHMVDITDCDDKYEGYYIPHHAVIKNESTTTKVRVVFDASAKSSTNVTLNDILMVGPTIQNDLIESILRFRLHNVVLAADLQKMYRQIKVCSHDSIYQKIIWREKESDALSIFKLNTVTQCTGPAPFLAARTLHQLADNEGHDFPLAALSLKNDFYVDDLLTGAQNVEDAIELKAELTAILKRGGFILHKWLSNNKMLVTMDNECDSTNICLDTSCSRKLLGIHWEYISDKINYKINMSPSDKVVTKRTILSEISQLYDPLGLLGPVIVLVKLIMQELWKLKLTWDESVPQLLNSEWRKLKSELNVLNKFEIPRHAILKNPCNVQLHGFADASDKAYGACIYLRSVDTNNKVLINLICAKSRIAPLKTVSIPRLESCAATLLANLYVKTVNALKLKFDNVNFWTDSTIALAWIKSSPHLLKTFVANRVSEIQTLTKIEQWRHVPTHENPADTISRGQTPVQFLENSLWQRGPSWLMEEEVKWPNQIITLSNIPELRSKISLVVTNKNNETLNRFSCILKLNRFVAYCLRFVNNAKSKNKLTGELTVDELRNAHYRIIKIIQELHFADEIHSLKNKGELNSKSKIICLNVFLDEFGILRVGGRLKYANLSYSQKYPMLLPKNEHITTLIIRNEHNKNWHAGVQATLNAIRYRYWPLDGKNVTRSVVHKCIRYSKLSPKIPNYVMGSLPLNRLRSTRPFLNVGIDYCGPFFLKEKKFRNTTKLKSYVSVFVCFSTKAIHMELVTDLTTDSCLEAIRRFVARRGKPDNIYTDNATNVIGVKKEILKAKAFFLSEDYNKQISHSLTNLNIKWHFIPPRSPHFGGLWDAGVKSFKKHLYRTVGEKLFTYEQFNTCIIEIEAILNSRPLAPISSDPNDFIALTPAHFIIGDSLTNIPEQSLTDVPDNRLSLWQKIQQIKQHFCKRWYKEYLNELRTRSKWDKDCGSLLQIGTLVTIKEDNLPPMQWNMGRVVAVHPGDDNVVRVASIKTNAGIFKRSVKRLCPLPINVEQENSNLNK